MNRRALLKVAGLMVVGGTVVTLTRAGASRPDMAASVPDGTRLTIHEPGTYRITGRVRLDAPQVEISGITHTQRISWSNRDRSAQPTAGFTTFEHFDGPEMTRTIHVRGGRLESVTAEPMDFA
jgi:hypothetical protein